MNMDGRTIGGFSHDEMIEPIAVAVNNNDEVLIADNGVGIEREERVMLHITATGNAAFTTLHQRNFNYHKM